MGTVPRLQQYYGALRLPTVLPAALRIPSLGGTTLCPSVSGEVGGHTTLAGIGQPVPTGALNVETAGSPKFLGNPCLHALLSDLGGTAHQAYWVYRCCLPRISPCRLPRSTDFEAQSHSLQTRCLRFAARVTPEPRKTRFRLGASLAGRGFHPRDSRGGLGCPFFILKRRQVIFTPPPSFLAHGMFRRVAGVHRG